MRRFILTFVVFAGTCAAKPTPRPTPARTPEPVVGRTAIELPLPPPTEPVAALAEKLTSADASIRRQAAWDLAGLEEPAPGIVEALGKALGDDVKDVRYAAAWALGHFERADPACTACLTYDSPPVFEFQALPEYPPTAFTLGIEGTVDMDILIGEEGEVAHARVSHSIPGLDEAALACVRDWRFKPARRGGRAVPVLAVAPVRFHRRGAVNRPSD